MYSLPLNHLALLQIETPELKLFFYKCPALLLNVVSAEHFYTQKMP